VSPTKHQIGRGVKVRNDMYGADEETFLPRERRSGKSAIGVRYASVAVSEQGRVRQRSRLRCVIVLVWCRRWGKGFM
jgi:hypothetical protein